MDVGIQLSSEKDVIPEQEVRLVIFSLSLVFSLVGTTGNGIVLYILTRGTQAKMSSSKLLVIALAVCDLATCAFILPMEMFDMLTGINTNWSRFVTREYCETCTFITMYIGCIKFHLVSVISVERYILVCHPYKASAMLSVTKVTKVIVLGLFVAFAVSLPLPLSFSNRVMKLNGTGAVFCSLFSDRNVDSTSWRIYFSVLFVLYYLTPLILLACMYTCIFRTLRRESSATQVTDETTAQQTATRLSQARLMLSIAVIFALLNTPYFIVLLLRTFGVSLQQVNGMLLVMTVRYLAGLNSVINPFVYCGHAKSFFIRQLASFFNKFSSTKHVTDSATPSISISLQWWAIQPILHAFQWIVLFEC